MDNIDVDLYEGDINFQSDDDKVTRALIFYLKAKAFSEVIFSAGIITVIAILFIGIVKVGSSISSLF